MKYYLIIFFGVANLLADASGVVAVSSEEMTSRDPEVNAIPLAELTFKIEKNKEDGKWYILFKCEKWKIMGNSFSRRGEKGEANLVFGEFVGVRDAAGSVAPRILEVKAGSSAKLYLDSDQGAELLIKKFDGKVWSDPS